LTVRMRAADCPHTPTHTDAYEWPDRGNPQTEGPRDVERADTRRMGEWWKYGKTYITHGASPVMIHKLQNAADVVLLREVVPPDLS
jgi:hypothetical protein